MEIQPTLFGGGHDAYGSPLARPTDPETSKAAAADMREKLQAAYELAYAALVQHPGLTSRELEAAVGVDDGVIRKRLADMRAMGWARNGDERRCTISGKRCQTWWASSRNGHDD